MGKASTERQGKEREVESVGLRWQWSEVIPTSTEGQRRRVLAAARLRKNKPFERILAVLASLESQHQIHFKKEPPILLNMVARH